MDFKSKFILLSIFLFLLIPFVILVQNNNKMSSGSEIILKINTDSPIHIIGDDSLNTTASSGNGTKINPYIIENYIINAGGSGTDGIFIENTSSFFIIRNCTIYGSENHKAGIRLENSTNGKMENNTIIDNYYGIYFLKADNSTISNNNIEYNNSIQLQNGDGIVGYYSMNCIFFNNTIEHCNYNGIHLADLTNCTILNNSIKYCDWNGISIYNMNNCTILNNIIENSGWDGFTIVTSNNCTIFNNTIEYCSEDGIYISNTTNCTFSDNNIKNCSDNGIHTFKMNNCTIFNNSIQYCKYGIYFKNSTNSTISNNNIKNCTIIGIYTYNSNNCSILKNVLEFCDYYAIDFSNSEDITFTLNKMRWCGLFIGNFYEVPNFQDIKIDDSNEVNEKKLYIYKNQNNLRFENFTNAGQILVYNCSNSTIKDVNLSYSSLGMVIYLSYNISISNISSEHNKMGLYIANSSFITLQDSILGKNNGFGCRLDYSNNNTIKNNYMYYNNEGRNPYDYHSSSVYLGLSDYNQFINNKVNNNDVFGVMMYGSDYNTFQNNEVNENTEIGFDIRYSDHNCFDSNSISRNLETGLEILYSNYNEIFNNIIEENEEAGIEIYDSNNTMISNNEINKNGWIGIYLDGSCNNIILENMITSSGGRYEVIFDNGANNNILKLNSIYHDNMFVIRDDSEGNLLILNRIQFFNPTQYIVLFYYISLLGLIIRFLRNISKKPEKKPSDESIWNDTRKISNNFLFIIGATSFTALIFKSINLFSGLYIMNLPLLIMSVLTILSSIIIAIIHHYFKLEKNKKQNRKRIFLIPIFIFSIIGGIYLFLLFFDVFFEFFFLIGTIYSSVFVGFAYINFKYLKRIELNKKDLIRTKINEKN